MRISAPVVTNVFRRFGGTATEESPLSRAKTGMTMQKILIIPIRRQKKQVIPEGEGPVKTNLGVGLVRSASFLVLAGRVEVGVVVKARAQPDRVAAVGP